MNTFTQLRTTFCNIIPVFTYILDNTMKHLYQDIRYVVHVRWCGTNVSG